MFRRTWATIDLDALVNNLNYVKNRVGKDCEIMAVVKADAYGHGDFFIPQTLAKEGISNFAVSNMQEAIRLRYNGITDEILILGVTPPDSFDSLIAYNLTQTVYSPDYARQLAAHRSRFKKLPIHIKIDTGMNRIGLPCENPEQTADQVCEITEFDCFDTRGIFTHLCCADSHSEESIAKTRRQTQLFEQLITILQDRNVSIRYKHCLNSAGIISLIEKKFDFVRPGIILYGHLPSEDFENQNIPITPVMQLKTTIGMVKDVKKNETISYGCSFTAPHNMKVAAVPIGYADGYSRRLSNKGRMIINGIFAPVVGRICMDYVMLDVSDISGIQLGDTVTVFGEDNGKYISVTEIADIIDSISYEVCCLIGKRVPRVYIQGGRIVGEIDYQNHFHPNC